MQTVGSGSNVGVFYTQALHVLTRQLSAKTRVHRPSLGDDVPFDNMTGSWARRVAFRYAETPVVITTVRQTGDCGQAARHDDDPSPPQTYRFPTPSKLSVFWLYPEVPDVVR